ncbi:MAG: hypothetical protein AABY51_00440 [Deltaproteobacteria bacterium]
MSKKSIFWFVLFFCANYSSGMENACAVETEWHGQFRINSYYQDANKENVFTRGDDIQASRLRFRPTLDHKWDNGVKAHIQLNIGHINSNVSNARYTLDGSSSGDPVVALRHGYISAPIPNHQDFTLVAGLVPMSDKFGDTLFSGDWDYNPLTYMLLGNVEGVEMRMAHGNLDEGAESSHPADDLDQWFFDVDTKSGFGASFYALNDNTKPTSSVTGASTTNEYYAGVRYNGKLSSVDLNAFAIYNRGKRKVPPSGVNPTERKNSGFAVKAEVKVPVSKAKVGLLGIYASGDKDFGDATQDSANSFITPMSIVGTTGYWGYTGKLNVQGPTDTGVDTSFVNIDGGGYATSNTNLGNGLVTIQANAAIPITDKLEGYAAAGWFSHTDAAAGFKKYIGTDLYAQLKYLVWENLTFEAGVDYAMLGKGHPDSVALGAANQSTRNETLVFSRLQLEF